jgi:Protein of unknown function (DUF1499)
MTGRPLPVAYSQYCLITLAALPHNVVEAETVNRSNHILKADSLLAPDLRSMIAASLVVVAIGILCLRFYLGREDENRLRPDEIVDFSARHSNGRDNVYAICPANFCVPPADRESPVFAIGWERLRDYWREAVELHKGIDPIAIGGSGRGRRLTYIQRSPVLRFPDIVTVEFIDLGNDRSTLAIDSRSRYGKSDFGVNRRRVSEWMRLLRVPPAS